MGTLYPHRNKPTKRCCQEIHYIIVHPFYSAQGLRLRSAVMNVPLGLLITGGAVVHSLYRSSEQTIKETASQPADQCCQRQCCERAAEPLYGPKNQAKRERAQI